MNNYDYHEFAGSRRIRALKGVAILINYLTNQIMIIVNEFWHNWSLVSDLTYGEILERYSNQAK